MIRNSERKNEDKRADKKIPYSSVLVSLRTTPDRPLSIRRVYEIEQGKCP
jgi:hypothetical protein